MTIELQTMLGALPGELELIAQDMKLSDDDRLTCQRVSDEIERLREDSALLAWVLAHPETCAEVLQDAAAAFGEARDLLEQRRAGLVAHRLA